MPLLKEIIHLDPSEAIVANYRAHGIIIIPYLFILSIAIFILLLFSVPLFSLGTGGILIFLFILLLLNFLFVGIFIRWIGSITVLTTRRIITIQRLGVFKKSVKEHTLDTITEISYTSKGMLQTGFRLGDIHITGLYTGTHHTIALHIAEPQRVLDQISGCVSRFGRSRAFPSSAPDVPIQHSVRDSGELRPVHIEAEKEQERDAVNWK